MVLYVAMLIPFGEREREKKKNLASIQCHSRDTQSINITPETQILFEQPSNNSAACQMWRRDARVVSVVGDEMVADIPSGSGSVKGSQSGLLIQAANQH